MYIQFGAGICGPDSWINFDASPTLRLQRLPLLGRAFQGFGPKFPPTVVYGDIVRGLPVAKGSCKAIYCSHVLEHLSLFDFRIALQNTHQYLAPCGRFRFVLPDLERLINVYVQSESEDAAPQFMRDTRLGEESRPRGLLGLMRAVIGNSAHRWMWDFKSIAKELTTARFTGIRRAQFGDSGDSQFD